ncbi:MAG: TIGR00180 family glycosyltransferase [Reyranellaceae bacterium]
MNFGAEKTPLTIILPTRNRPALCRAHLRFLRDNGIRHRIIVADSSDVVDDGLRRLCSGRITYRRFEPTMRPEAKLIKVARSVRTPFVAQITDDDISFPHAIDACLEHVLRHEDCVVAEGYVLGFRSLAGTIDINRVEWFVPSIAEPTPLRRLYELMRRYQPLYWAVSRTDAYIRAMTGASHENGAIFKELAFTARMALLGHSARLPIIQTLRGAERSHTRASESHPFQWFLRDASSFASSYAAYRRRLIEFLQDLEASTWQRAGNRLGKLLGIQRDTRDFQQVIDIIHATYLGREIDREALDAAALRLLGDAVSSPAPPAAATPDPAAGDLVRASAVPGRRYVWRRATVDTGPEVDIGPGERARVEAALDKYVLD